MDVSGMLKSMRGKGDDSEEEGSHDPDESNSTSRIIKLTDEEEKSMESVKPGEEVVLTVRGNVEGDHFHVMSVEKQGGGEEGMEGMPEEVAQKVNPFLGMMK
jgi:hypothetical protein